MEVEDDLEVSCSLEVLTIEGKMDMDENRAKGVWLTLENDGLVGSWSWSDVLAHTVRCVAYGMARNYPLGETIEARRARLDDLLMVIRKRVLYILEDQ